MSPQGGGLAEIGVAKSGKELVHKVRRIGKAKVYVPVYHSALYLTPKDLLQLGVNYTSVAPPPPTLVLYALRESAQRIREEAGQ